MFGICRAQQERGIILHEERAICSSTGRSIQRSAPMHGPKALLDLDFVYEWFHNDCPIVELDKSSERKFKRKGFQCAGKKRKLFFQRRIMNGLKKDLVKSFTNSDVYKELQRQNNRSIGERTIQSCICLCMKPTKYNQCVCTVCVQFRYLLSAWHKQRKLWHATPCECPNCQGPKFEAFMGASKSQSVFKAALCCPPTVRPHLTLPQYPEDPPSFYRLKCCKKTPSWRVANLVGGNVSFFVSITGVLKKQMTKHGGCVGKRPH